MLTESSWNKWETLVGHADHVKMSVQQKFMPGAVFLADRLKIKWSERY